jgi:nitrogen PTS system EIIA component
MVAGGLSEIWASCQGRNRWGWTRGGLAGDNKAMPHRDFDVQSLARYLHTTPQQVEKLADRSKLPGRKVGGAWRFAKADIHHWFERRIGASDELQLIEVENVLQRSSPSDEETDVCIAEMLPIEAIAVPLCARTRKSVIDSMVELAARTGWLWDTKEMAEAVKAREDIHTTALENGVALLHPRRPMAKILAQPFLALGCTTSGIPFGGEGPMTDVFFLICSMEDRGHLRVLARLSRILASAGFLNALHQVDDATAAYELIVETEEKL